MKSKTGSITIRLLTYLFFTSLLINCSSEDNAATLTPPNIILILTDDQGYGDIGAHGNPHIKTPNLDQLYAESIRFTDFHVATTCAPSRAGILSGIHCNRAGAWHTVNGRSFLDSRYKTIADYAGRAGYESAIFGKWHLGDNYPFRPQDHGFDQVLIHGGGGVGQTPDGWNNDQFGDRYFENKKTTKFQDYSTDVWFDGALDFIEAKSKKKEQFFCYISTNAPHSPHFAPKEYLDIYRDNDSVNNVGFYAQITQFDDRLGDLETKLTELDIKDNTILIFLTDNGTSSGTTLNKDGYVVKGFNAGMRGKKASEYEGGHRVPLFIRFPESMGIPQAVHDELLSYTDLLPTLVDLLGWQTNNSYLFDGSSFAELLRKGEQKDLASRILITDTQRNERPVKWKNTSIMQGKWRLVNKHELYDISKDPGQRNNLIADHPDRVNRLVDYYDKWWSRLEKDIAEDLRIVVGSEVENPSLITCHDWHSGKNPPWHQSHIRTAKIDNGYWLLNAQRAGNYKIALYRWPPALSLSMVEAVEKGDEVSGGNPYPPGIGLTIREATISINDREKSIKVDDNAISANFNVSLPAGPFQLQTTLIDSKGIERGAYYVTMEYLGKSGNP